MTKQLTKEQLDSITPKTVKAYRKVKAMVLNMDIREGTMVFNKLLKEGMAMRDFGLTWKEVEKGLSDKLELNWPLGL